MGGRLVDGGAVGGEVMIPNLVLCGGWRVCRAAGV